MAAPKLKCVETYRRSILLTATGHPMHWLPVAGAVFSLVLAGWLLIALAILGLDLVALVLLLPLPPLRRRLGRYADQRARKRASQELELLAQCDWQSLDAVARRTEAFNPRRDEVDSLLNVFLNLALTHRCAKECADTTAMDVVKESDCPETALVVARRQAARRAQQAVEALQAQLDSTAQRIRLACDLAVAEQCEAVADLWLSDVPDPEFVRPALAAIEVTDPLK